MRHPLFVLCDFSIAGRPAGPLRDLIACSLPISPPTGGGSFLNEVDGNLTATKTESTVEMYWQGKFRGPEFAPMHFLIKTVTHQDLKDRKGRLIPTCLAELIGEQATDDIAAQRAADEKQVLELISLNPKISMANIATAMNWQLYTGEPNRMRPKRGVDSRWPVVSARTRIRKLNVVDCEATVTHNCYATPAKQRLTSSR